VIAVSGQTGEMVPLHCTAHGKALLADCEAADLKTIFGSAQLRNYTKQTTRTLAQLADTCAQIRARGYATDDGEFQQGVRCSAAPIRAHDGMVIGSIEISAPLLRFPKERYRTIGLQVKEAADQISAGLSSPTQKRAV